MLPRWSFRYAAYEDEEDWDVKTLSRINNQLEMYIGRLPGGPGDLTLAELQEMAGRQQQQMEAQQQVLVAKEQRLKYLKQQEARHAQLASESERLRRIRERVESQELKLKKLRALRGQAEQYRANNSHLNSELDSVKAVFNEKEKELALAVAKVEQLTRQLKELRNGAVISLLSGKNQSAAALELERLKKELLIRNKLNEEQNNTIAAKENVLREQKEKVVSMDNRIQELQQRLKKRKLQEDQSNQTLKQANKSNAKQNKAENQPEFGSKETKGMYGTDPYIQYAPQDVAKDDSYTRSGSFAKQDPKYQTLPSNVKLTQAPKPISGNATSRIQPNELNNNNEGLEEYKLPSVLPMNPNTFAPGNNNNQKMPNQQPLKSPRFNNNDFSKPNQNFMSQPMSRQGVKDKPNTFYQGVPKTNFPNHSNDPPDHRKVPLPEPLPGRTDHGGSSSHPVISINEEERQAGSGQSSPASSEGSDSSGGIQIRDGNEESINTASIGSVSAMIEKLNKGKSKNNQTTKTEDASGANIPYSSQFGANQNLDRGRLNRTGPDHQNLQGGPSNRHLLHPLQGTNQAVNSSSHNQNNGVRLDQGQAVPSDSTGLKGPPMSTSQPFQPSGSNISQPPTQAPQLNLKPAPTYRYASKNQIANTYMGRLGGAAMERYQQNLNKLYKNLESSQKEAESTSGESSADVTRRGQHSSASEGVTGQEHFGSVSPHDYPDIASDKGSYKLNTPKQVRRKHSDSENEDLNRALQERQNYEQQTGLEQNKTNNTSKPTPQQDGKPSFPSSSSSSSSQSTIIDNEKNKQRMVEEKEKDKLSALKMSSSENGNVDKTAPASPLTKVEVVRRTKSNLKSENSRKSTNRVSFDPLALLLDASLEGELDLVKKVAVQVDDVSTPNDEGITALHNAICAGHFEIVKFLIEFGCDVNSPDSDGWTPLHCAASCNNLPMVRFLVEHGACVFATTISDQETAADKCEEEEDGYDGCSDYLYSTQEKLGITNNGDVYAVFDYTANNTDELSFVIGDKLSVLRKGDESEKEWWWAKLNDEQGYIPRNLLGLYPRVIQQPSEVSEC